MKRYLIFLLFILIVTNSFSQDFSDLKKIRLSTKEDCMKAQSKVLECCNYLLSKPCVKNPNSMDCILFVLNWMDATPDYKLRGNYDFARALKPNQILSGAYFAAIAKIALEKNIKESSQTLEDESINLLIRYIEDPNNNVKITKRLQKFLATKR